MKKILIIALFVLVILSGSVYAAFLRENRPDETSTQNINTQQKTSVTVDEVAKHNTKDDCWTIIKGTVYDVTSYISSHPGGDRIIQACGKDATRLFETQGNSGKSHSPTAESILARFKISTLKQ